MLGEHERPRTAPSPPRHRASLTSLLPLNLRSPFAGRFPSPAAFPCPDPAGRALAPLPAHSFKPTSGAAAIHPRCAGAARGASRSIWRTRGRRAERLTHPMRTPTGSAFPTGGMRGEQHHPGASQPDFGASSKLSAPPAASSRRSPSPDAGVLLELLGYGGNHRSALCLWTPCLHQGGGAGHDTNTGLLCIHRERTDSQSAINAGSGETASPQRWDERSGHIAFICILMGGAAMPHPSCPEGLP